MNTLRLDDPTVAEMVRGQVEGAAVASVAVGRMLDEVRPDCVVLLNGRFFVHWAMVEHCRQRGIRFITHERGLRKNTIRFAENARTHDLAPYRRLWDEWGEVALDAEALEFAWTVLEDRRHGRNFSWNSFSPPPQEKARVREELGLRPGHKMVAVFGSSDDESAVFKARRAGALPDAANFLPAVCVAAKRMPEVDFVIRMHPNLASIVGTNVQGIQHAIAVKAVAPPNVRVVMPRDPLSSYTLVDLADAAVVYASTIGLEAAALGKPVLVVAQATYSHTGCTRPLESMASFVPQLREALARGPDAEAARSALRWAAAYFSEFATPYDLVQEEPQHLAKLQFSSVSELAPGMDAVLDRVCGLILRGERFFPLPTGAERARARDAEDAFLSERVGVPVVEA